MRPEVATTTEKRYTRREEYCAFMPCACAAPRDKIHHSQAERRGAAANGVSNASASVSRRRDITQSDIGARVH